VKYRIVGDEAEGYVLLDETETVRCVDRDPRKLSKWAFANDATSVRHDYSLIAFEEGQRK
jgi:hypothetical protein